MRTLTKVLTDELVQEFSRLTEVKQTGKAYLVARKQLLTSIRTNLEHSSLEDVNIWRFFQYRVLEELKK